MRRSLTAKKVFIQLTQYGYKQTRVDRVITTAPYNPQREERRAC